MDRRRFLRNTLLALPAARAAHAGSLRLEEVTISDLEQAYGEGWFPARAAVEWYLERIESLNRRGPKVNAVIEINPDALRIAEALDRERLSGHVRGPLHGVPFLMKDNIDTADRMSTTCGSLALVNRATVRDAFVVQALRASGAVLVGKTNLSEWAGFRSTSSISGWSGRGGLTHNPYALDRNASGSSSGSAAAVSSNFSAVGVGTESDGSVTAPASVNGIVGIKPTVGLLSRSGIIPISHSQDTAGPMARTVRDAAILLSAMTGKAGVDYTKYLDGRGLKGMRLGVERNYFGTDVATNHLFGNCLAEMKRHGAELVDPANLPSHGEYDEDELEVFLYEFKAGLNAYLGRRPGAGVRSLADVIAFNQQRSSEEMPYFQQDLLERAQAKGPLTEKAYLDARARCVKLSRAEGIDAVITKYKVDAIVAPTAGPAPRNSAIPATAEWPVCTKPAAVAGYPHITVPAGLVNGLPVGISFFGPAWSEPVMLKLAYAFELVTRARQQPTFAPSSAI
jgi:amidase